MTQVYHDKVTELFDEYYREGDGEKPSPSLRIERSNSIIEEYIDKHDKTPPNAVLSRLATYLLLDDLSDPHPDKMAREEYPIASKDQVKRYFEKAIILEEIEYDFGDVRGHVKSSGMYGNKMRNALLEIESNEIKSIGWGMVFAEVLSNREVFILESVLLKDATQVEVAEEIGISQPRVAALLTGAIDKLRKHLLNTLK